MREELFAAHYVDLMNHGNTIKHLNFRLFKSDILGIYGTFSSGKSMILDLAEGKVSPSRGEVAVYEKNVDYHQGIPQCWPMVARIEAEATLLGSLSVWENLCCFKGKKGHILVDSVGEKRRIQGVLQKYNIQIPINRRVESLSSYEILLLEIIKARLAGAEIILIDDFFLKCTEREEREIQALFAKLQSEGIAFLFTSSDMEILESYAECILFLNKGQIFSNAENNPENKQKIQGIVSSIFREKIYVRDSKTAVVTSPMLTLNIESVFTDGGQQPLDFYAGEIVCVADVDGFLFDILKKRLGYGYKSRYPMKVKFLNLGSLDNIIECLSPGDNLNLGIFDKVSRAGIPNHKLIKCQEEDFARWYGDPELLERNHCYNLPKRDRLAINLYKTMMANDRLLVVSDTDKYTDAITHQMLKDFYSREVESGKAVWVFVSPNSKPENFADRYVVAGHIEQNYGADYTEFTEFLSRYNSMQG